MFDGDAVKGVLINLFSNVIKFSSSTKVIELRLKQIPGAIQLIVADRGVGIPADELPNIFNRFYRVKNSSDIDVRGSGLGLTLVKHVIDAHGWQIDVDSIQGQGTTFSITVPTNPEYKKVS